MVSVEGVSGFDVGEVSLTGEIVRLQMKKRNVKEENPEMKKFSVAPATVTLRSGNKIKYANRRRSFGVGPLPNN